MPSARACAMAGAMIPISSSPQQPAFAGMRIEPGDGDARLGDAEVARRHRRQADGARSAAIVDGLDRVSSGTWIDDEQHAQLVVRQHHGDVVDTGLGRPAFRYGRDTCMPAAASASLWIGAVTMAP